MPAVHAKPLLQRVGRRVCRSYLAALLIVAGATGGCHAPVEPDPSHLARIDSLVAERTNSGISSSALLALNPRTPPEAPTGTLELRAAVDRTLAHNLGLIASAENLAIAQAQLAQAGLLQNPTLGQTGAIAFPLSSNAGATPFDVLISQAINTFFTRPYRVAVAESQRFQAGIDLANQAFDLSQQAEAKYQEMVHLLRDRRLAERTAESYKRAVSAAEARAKVGVIPQPDVNRARIQYEDALRQIRHLRTQYQRAAREMNWLMGVPSEPRWELPADLLETPKVLPSLPRDVRVEDLGSRYRLDLLRADFDRKVNEASVKVARLGLIPEISVGVDVARDNAKHWTVGPAVSRSCCRSSTPARSRSSWRRRNCDCRTERMSRSRGRFDRTFAPPTKTS